MAAQDNGNWFKLYRGILDNTAWAQGSNIQRVLMITLLAKAWWKPGKYIWAGRVVHMQPGQLITTLGELTELCSASKSSIRTALDHLETVEFLTRQSTHRGMLISIVNWGKYQQDTSEISTPDSTPSTHQSHTNPENLAVDQHTSRTPTFPYNMYKNIKEGEEGKKIRREEGKKGAPSPVLERIREFESAHHSPALTAALVDWARMRKADRCQVQEKDLPDLFEQVVGLSGGSTDKAVAIVRQSIDRHWKQFWALKDPPARASPPTRYQPVERTDPSAPPPPRIEDYPGDPEGFKRDAAAWASAYGVDNRRIEKKYSEGTPTDEERERILKAMGH